MSSYQSLMLLSSKYYSSQLLNTRSNVLRRKKIIILGWTINLAQNNDIIEH